MQALADGDPWYGKSVKGALENIDHLTAVKRINNQHNIAELLHHMIQWKKFSFEKVAGDENFNIQLNSDQDWKIINKLSAEEWKHLVEGYFEITDAFVNALKSIKKDWLDQIVPHRKYNYTDLLSGIIEHDIYHLGQIVIISKTLHS